MFPDDNGGKPREYKGVYTSAYFHQIKRQE